jgi:hypothetical protein
VRREDERPRIQGTELFALALVVGVAAFVRIWHLGSPSLWWDEIVHVHSAAGPGFADVWRTVRAGVPPGFGNAGAVPLDYLLLHAWMRLVAEPAASGLEVYYRVPAMVWSTAAVAGLFLWARRYFDLTIAVLASLLVALSIPHVLYAIEARSYALLSLVTVLDLWAFSRLVVRRGDGGWLPFTLGGAAVFLSGVPGLFLIALQHAILGVLFLRQRRVSGWKPLLRLMASAVLIGGMVVLYYYDSIWWAKYGRGREVLIAPLTMHALRTFAYRSPVLLWGFFASLPLALWYGWRRGGGRLAIALYLVLSFLAIPALIGLAREKEYYFHFRHALFLLPHFDLVIAIGLAVALRSMAPLRFAFRSPEARASAALALGALVILALQGETALAYLRDPDPFLAESKTLRDLRGLTEELQARLAGIGAGEKYLLVVERRRPGHLANPSLAEYLGWHGLADHVVLYGTDRPEETLAELARSCRAGCEGREIGALSTELRLSPPFGIRPEIRALLGVTTLQGGAMARLAGAGVVYWDRPAGRAPLRFRGYAISPLRGLTWYDLRGFSPPSP